MKHGWPFSLHKYRGQFLNVLLGHAIRKGETEIEGVQLGLDTMWTNMGHVDTAMISTTFREDCVCMVPPLAHKPMPKKNQERLSNPRFPATQLPSKSFPGNVRWKSSKMPFRYYGDTKRREQKRQSGVARSPNLQKAGAPDQFLEFGCGKMVCSCGAEQICK